MKDTTPASLFGPVQDFRPPSAKGSATSRAAAENIKPLAMSLREKVFAAIANAGEYGLTDAEGEETISMSGDTWRPRRWELAKAGRVRDSGRKRTLANGNEAVVWISVSKEGVSCAR